jgi:hypothetical protein
MLLATLALSSPGGDDEIIAEAIQTALGDVEDDTEDEHDELEAGGSNEKIGLDGLPWLFATTCKSSASITLTPMVYHCWRYRSSCEGCRHISAVLLINLVCRPQDDQFWG